jgi:uncharacterized protein with PIN domain
MIPILFNITGKDKEDLSYVGGSHSHHENGSLHDRMYHCLMKCEGSKTYHQSGYCPDCNMKLVPVGDSHRQH